MVDVADTWISTNFIKLIEDYNISIGCALKDDKVIDYRIFPILYVNQVKCWCSGNKLLGHMGPGKYRSKFSLNTFALNTFLDKYNNKKFIYSVLLIWKFMISIIPVTCNSFHKKERCIIPLALKTTFPWVLLHKWSIAFFVARLNASIFW